MALPLSEGGEVTEAEAPSDRGAEGDADAAPLALPVGEGLCAALPVGVGLGELVGVALGV